MSAADDGIPASLAEGRFLRLVAVRGWEYVERRNASGVIAIAALTDDRRLVMVEQYRPPVGRRVIELPAGLVGDDPGAADEPLETAARRELEEETGFTARELSLVAVGPSSAGLTSEVITFFTARGLTRTGDGGGVAGEDIVVHLVPLDDIRAWLDRRLGEGVLIDPKIYAGLYFLSC
jgi:ADP-ribose pyrophosphatase